MAYVPNSGSVVAFQSDATKLVATVSVSGVLPPSSMTALQGTNPWTVQLTSGSVATTVGNSSVQVVGAVPTTSVVVVPGIGVLGSVAALQGTNPWLVGNSSVMLTPGVNAIGSVATLQGTNPWLVQTVGSVMNQYREDTAATSMIGNAILFRNKDDTSMMSIVGPLHPLPVVGSVSGTVATNANPASVQLLGGTNAIGSVAVLQGTNPWVVGNSSVQVVGVMPTQSVMVVPGIGVLGSIAALQGTNPWVVGNSSVQVVGTMPTQSVMVVPGIGVLGSVATLQGTNPWVIGNTSVLLLPGLNTIGSVATLQGTNPWIITSSGSILGNYGVNSVFANNNTGFADWAVRNDTVASLITTDKTYGPWAVDSAGRGIVKPFAANESSIFGTASTVNAGDTASVLLVAGAGAGLKNYITDYQISNTGSVATLIKFTEGGASILGITIAPAGGGSNMPGMTWPISNVVPNQPINLVTGTASSILYVSFRGFKAP